MAKTTETFNRSFALSASTTHASARGGVICHEYFQSLVRAQCLYHVAWRWGVPLACHTFNRSFALSASTTQDDTHCIQYTTTLSIARSRSVPVPLYCPLCPREQGRVAFNRSFALSASTTTPRRSHLARSRAAFNRSFALSASTTTRQVEVD